MKSIFKSLSLSSLLLLTACSSNYAIKGEPMNLTTEWDKTFKKSELVTHKKVTFKNRYGITLVGDLYIPKSKEGKLPALAVSGPYGRRVSSFGTSNSNGQSFNRTRS